MLLEISLRTFAIIEEISLNFEKGMTVLTETGAGKSIIIDAMNMMLGSRATRPMSFDTEPQKRKSEGLLTVENNRHLTALFEEQGQSGPMNWSCKMDSVSRINGRMVVIGLRGRWHLVDIHGQHDQKELMRPQLHRYAGWIWRCSGTRPKARIVEAFEDYKRLRK